METFFATEYPLSQILLNYWPIFPAAFLISLVMMPVCRRLAMRFGIVDYPDNKVKTHAKPTAYLGGLGILAGLLAGLAIGVWLLRIYKNTIDPVETMPSWIILIGITIGAVIACVVGVLDDIFDIRPWQKFLGQAVAAVALIMVGVRPDLQSLFEFFYIELSDTWELVLGIPIVLFFILGATNSLNLLDGLDGLCAGVTVIITTAFLLLALSLATWGHSPIGDPVRLVLCLAMVGGTLGFMPFNRHPAKIFMGDAGSMLLGFVAGTLMILFTNEMGRWSTGAIIIFGLPILDTAVALVRRFINKRPLFVSDRGHIYDQFIDHGLSLKMSVKISYLLAIFYAMIGLSMTKFRFRYSILVFLAVVTISALLVWRLGFLKMPPENQESKNNNE